MLQFLPRDWREATLLGRLLTRAGPTPILVRKGRVLDVAAFAPTTAEFAALWKGEESLPPGVDLGELEHLNLVRDWDRGAASSEPRLLAPIDLQCIKAS